MSSVPPPSCRTGIAAASTTVSSAASAGNHPPSAPTASTLTSASAQESQNCLEQLWTSIASLVSSLWTAVMGFFCRASAPAHVEATTAAPTIPQPVPPATVPRPLEPVARRAETFINEMLALPLRAGFQTFPYKAALLIQLNGEILSVRGRELDSPDGADELIRSSVEDLIAIEGFINESSCLMISLILLQDKTGGLTDTREFSRTFNSTSSRHTLNTENTTWQDRSGIPGTLIASYTDARISNRREHIEMTQFFMENNPGPLDMVNSF